MKRLKKILAVVGIVVLVLVLLAQLLPGNYRVERSVVMAAKPDAIFPWINELKRWPEWSPWTAAKDPSLVHAYEGPESGVGAISKWDSKVWGNGQMKLTESDPAQGVKWELNVENGKFISDGALTFEPAGDSTKATWSFSGKLGRNPLNRFFGLFMGKMAGADFELGLANLKKKVESKQP
jgi:hypothetical protein